MKTPTVNHICLVLILVLLSFGTRGISYGQVSADATLSGLIVSPVDIVGFDSNITEYHVGVANSVTQATITATTTDAGATIQIGKSVTDRNTVASGSGQVVSLDEGPNPVYVWVTAADGITRKDYTIVVGKSVDSAFGWKAVDDFNTLRAAGNRSIDGIWSDGTTMWVADESEDEKLYAYDLTSRERVPDKDFNTLDAVGNDDPDGIWSDGGDDVCRGRPVHLREDLCVRHGDRGPGPRQRHQCAGICWKRQPGGHLVGWDDDVGGRLV